MTDPNTLRALARETQQKQILATVRYGQIIKEWQEAHRAAALLAMAEKQGQ